MEKEQEIGAPLQGSLSKILVQEGDQVELNTPLFIIEAMKMENVIKSPVDGTISELVVAKGDSVDKNKILCKSYVNSNHFVHTVHNKSLIKLYQLVKLYIKWVSSLIII